MKLKIMLVLLSAFFAGCATGPVYKSEPITISSEDITQYWSYAARSKKIRFRMGNRNACYRLMPSAWNTGSEYVADIIATVSLTIDSNGRTYNHKIIKGTGSEAADVYLLDMASDPKWEPAADNKLLTPVVFTETYVFVRDEKICQPPENVDDFLKIPVKSMVYDVLL
jgi:hypothetical protein